ncbi:bone marrow proteoglycan-like isoform X2 [Ranitomeya imitator]|uniref:bone marrow proteoglycan-like isoform X2 n=1 Tax=Ranitomeya imitator TaxID=111125 RepID=UPI0037E72062
MWKLLLLLLVGTACAQESGDYEQENDQLIKVATNEDNIHELLDEDNDEDELDEEDLSLSQEIDQIELDFTEKAENEACPHNGTCHYRVFTKPHCFNKAKKICRSHRGNLSSVHSCTANRDLQWYIKLKASNVRYAWIGVWKSKLCRPYSTVDGSKLNYANWACNQNKTRGRWCVAMCVNTGKWYSFSCHKRLPSVCTY